MSFVKIWVHAVWPTKNRFPYLTKKVRDKVKYHIVENADTKGIHINFINGYYDHLHLLISMGACQSIGEIIHYIKGESSYWINKNNITEVKFAWQPEYYAVAIGQNQIEIVRDYIRNQEEHHKNITFEDEIILLLKKIISGTLDFNLVHNQ
jgi:REP-associated tyrosine transposase